MTIHLWAWETQGGMLKCKRGSAMAKTEAIAEVFLANLRSLPTADSDRVLLGFLKDGNLRRDFMDLATIPERTKTLRTEVGETTPQKPAVCPVVVIGKESVGKSVLIRRLTGRCIKDASPMYAKTCPEPFSLKH